MAGLAIAPLQTHEIDNFVRIHWAAFEPLEVDMILPMVYPAGLQPDLFDELRKRLTRETKGNVSDLCFAAKDSGTGEIVAVSRWAVNEHPASTNAEIDAEWEQVWQARFNQPAVAGVNRPLAKAALRAMIYEEWDIMQGRPYVSLRNLATHPSHQRRGAGALLLQDGIARFSERLHLPTYLDSGRNGRSLYEKHGFEVVRDFPFDGREYGGRSEAKHWCMVRPVQP